MFLFSGLVHDCNDDGYKRGRSEKNRQVGVAACTYLTFELQTPDKCNPLNVRFEGTIPADSAVEV